jgi:DNA-binding NtrC family response regulator
MTAKAQPQEIAELKQIGALDVIPKPFDPMTLAQSVREIWSTQCADAVPPQGPSCRPSRRQPRPASPIRSPRSRASS